MERVHRARRRGVRAILWAAAAASAWQFISAPAARAVDSTWNLNLNGSWSVAGNWTAGVPNAVGDSARFLSVITANTTVTQNLAGVTLGTIEFNDNNNYTISGNPITLDVAAGSAFITVNNAFGNGAHTISSSLTLNDTVNLTQNSTGTFTLSGAIGGTGALIKSGGGTTVLSGAAANTNTGNTTVNQGTLLLGKSTGINAIGGNGVLFIGDGVGGTNADVVRLSNSNQISNSVGVNVSQSGLFDLNGLSETVFLLTMTGGNVTTGAGTLTLSNSLTSGASSTTTGTISGNLSLGAQSSASFAIGDGTQAIDLDISAVISNGGIVKSGLGTLRFSGSSANTYTGTTTVNAGTLALNKSFGTDAVAGALVIGDGSGAGTVRLDNGNQIADGAVVTINAGTLTVNFFDSIAGLTMTAGSVNGLSALALLGNVTGNASGSTATIGSSQLDLSASTRTFTIADGGATVDMDVTSNVASGGVIKAGAGTLRFGGSGGNSFTGGVTVNEGTLVLAKSATNGGIPAGFLIIGDGTGGANADVVRLENHAQIGESGSLRQINSSGLLDLNNFDEVLDFLSFTGGNVTTGAGMLTLTNSVTVNAHPTRAIITGNLGFNGGTRSFFVANGADIVDLELDGVISDGGLTKSGAGELAFTGGASNTYAGITAVNDGTLLMAKTGGATSVAGALQIGDGAGSAGSTVARLLNSPEQIAASVTISADGLFDLNGLSEAITALTMTGGSVSTGGGTLTLGGNVTSAGDAATATISGTGTLNLGGAVRTFNVVNGVAATDMEVSAAISNGGFIKSGGGILRLSGGDPNTTPSGVSVNEGTLLLAKTPAINAVSGSLVIGDGIGGPEVDIVRFEASDQLPSGAGLLINSSGVLELNGFDQTLSSVNLAGGSIWTLAGTLTTNSIITSASSTPATITGKLAMGGIALTLNVADGAAANDLHLAAVISGAGAPIKTGAGTLRLDGNNTFSGGLNLNGGTLVIANNAALGTSFLFTSDGVTITAEGNRIVPNTLSLGIGNTFFDGAWNLTFTNAIVGSGGATKNGTGTLSFTTGNTLAGAWVLNAGTLNGANLVTTAPSGSLTMNGGTFTGLLTNRGTFVYNGGTFSGTLSNDGDATFNADFTVANGLTNSTNLTVGNGATLTVNGSGLNNNGDVAFAGGTLSGGGPLVNNGSISGFGTIGGSGGFTNNALIAQGAGNLTFITSGSNVNSGNIDLAAGRQLVLSGTSLINSGRINVNGGQITGFATLTNNAGGVVAGRGRITSGFINQAGTLLVEGGTLNVAPAFTNDFNGTILLGGSGAVLTGGTITNDGTIRGDGQVTNAVNTFSNAEIRADAGATLTFSGAVGANNGRINLLGGTLQFTGGALTNANLITGRGTLIAPSVANNNQITFSAGLTDFQSPLTNNSGGKVFVTGGGTSTFYSPITLNSGSEFRVSTNSTAVFLGDVTGFGAGSFTGSGTKIFEAGMVNVSSIATPGKTVVEAPASVTTGHVREASLTVNGLVTITPDGSAAGASRVGALAVDAESGAVLALNDNDLIVDYAQGDASPEFVIRDLVVAGLTGGGITSLTTPAGDTVLAVAEQSEWGQTQFNGFTLDDTTVIGKYTYYGDANLDGAVTSDDYVAVDVGIGTGDSWVQGDFNFSGSVTSDDYVAIDVNLGKGTPTPLAWAELKAEMIALHTEMFGAEYVEKLAYAEANGFAATLVPEPAGLAAIFASGMLLARSRRRGRGR